MTYSFDQILSKLAACRASEVSDQLGMLLAGDLAYSGKSGNYATHAIHAFAAKFPPQLARAFIEQLSEPGELVLDPMAGSGTALLEAALVGRRAIGLDIDPLALQVARAKTAPVDGEEALFYAEGVADWARLAVSNPALYDLPAVLDRYTPAAHAFFGYWFDPMVVQQLAGLLQGIERVCPKHLQPLFRVIFSSIIVTKSGGVSMARDLAHSRPHRDTGKRIPDAIALFGDKARKTIAAVAKISADVPRPVVAAADCRAVPLAAGSVDLIVTSPPYANAIDYIRAHKFSLIWFGHDPGSLSQMRRKYIGAEIRGSVSEIPSTKARRAIAEIQKSEPRKAEIVAHYFSDMQRALRQMLVVLKPGRAAVVVVGSSTIRGTQVQTPFALAEIGEALGFDVVGVKQRPIDRDRRLMPISRNGNGAGIEARMHEEHVIGFFKPYANER